MSKQQDGTNEHSFVIDGHGVNRGDIVIFHTNRDPISITVGASENRMLWKTVSGEDRYYMIVPILAMKIGENVSDAIAVAYHENLKKLIPMDSSFDDKGLYRSRGISAERSVTSVTVQSKAAAQPV